MLVREGHTGRGDPPMVRATTQPNATPPRGGGHPSGKYSTRYPKLFSAPPPPLDTQPRKLVERGMLRLIADFP